MINDNSFNFSFSGLKTSLINCVNKDEYNFDDIAASYQEAIVDTLIAKFDRAMNQYFVKSGIICGGVAANKRLREKLDKLDKNIIYPSMKYCTDNADMIAYLAEHKFKNNKINLEKDFSAYSRGMVL
jgi:N6-L-threonylcarbamoyladenine synthase